MSALIEPQTIRHPADVHAVGLIRTIEGRITYWSPAMQDRYGYAASDALGQMSQQLLKPAYWQTFEEVEAILAAQHTWNGGLILHRADGSPVVAGNFWSLHQAEGLVSEVHYDIVPPGTQASAGLADVLTTIAQELSQPLTAARGFIGGAKRAAAQSNQPRDARVDRGLEAGTAQLGRACEILRKVRALDEMLRDTRLREVHARFVATVAHSEHLVQAAGGLIRAAAGVQSTSTGIREQSVSERQKSADARAIRVRQRSAASAAERTPAMQPAQGHSRRGVGEIIRRTVICNDPDVLGRIVAALHTTKRAFLGKLNRGARLNAAELAVVLGEDTEGRLRHWLFGSSGFLIVRRGHTSAPSPEDGPLLPLAASVMQCLTAMCDLVEGLETRRPSDDVISGIERHLDSAQAELLRIARPQTCQTAPTAPADDSADGGFAALVRQILIIEQGIRPGELASALLLSYHALHARFTNRTGFSPEEIKRLLQLYPEPRLADHLLARSPYIAIPRPAMIDGSPYHPVRTGLQALRDLAELMHQLLQSNGAALPPDPAAVDEALRKLATARWSLTHIGRPGSPHALSAC